MATHKGSSLIARLDILVHGRERDDVARDKTKSAGARIVWKEGHNCLPRTRRLTDSLPYVHVWACKDSLMRHTIYYRSVQ